MQRPQTSRLSKKERYLQVALNSSREDALAIIELLPTDRRILIEAGTPLIKQYGVDIIRELRNTMLFRRVGAPQLDLLKLARGQLTSHTPYIIADMKTIDRGDTEVAMCARAGASAVIAMGSAPVETLNVFVASCERYGVDAMIDMMNVEYPLSVLRALKKQPRVVVLHRGVDEERDNRQKMLPLHEIRRIKGAYDTLIAVAGGDTPREVQSASFNDADIVVVWKSVYQKTSETSSLVEGFLKTIK